MGNCSNEGSNSGKTITEKINAKSQKPFTKTIQGLSSKLSSLNQCRQNREKSTQKSRHSPHRSNASNNANEESEDDEPLASPRGGSRVDPRVDLNSAATSLYQLLKNWTRNSEQLGKAREKVICDVIRV